ncbi:hypothetical protein [Salipaludibacillus aurantiacus]|uniref:Uncharacterized protein n=1 Tax=Salipaludibacillus aurantiacus TaxID=1601833 RepID=A0A1H9U0F5_9BACI|nr:hypothetical protein [Salipaludibacillus aurantiacus]SES02553.1 hypothetical protein SAMN05518684_106192 [Salipaludibacillus aurantiacus]
MLVRYSPVRQGDPIDYKFSDKKITATYQGESKTYDVTDMPYDDEGVMIVERIKGIRPILNVYDDGERVELRHHYGPEATDEEKFPGWVEVE